MMKTNSKLNPPLFSGREGDVVQSGPARKPLGWLLVVLNGLMAINSTCVFLGLLKTGIMGWLMINTCAPVIALFIAGFLLRNRVLMVAAALLMFRYGTLGLFTFSWSGTNLFAQAGHILMTLAIAYVLLDAIRSKDRKAIMIGAGLGIILVVLMIIIQGAWFAARPGLLEKIFQGRY